MMRPATFMILLLSTLFSFACGGDENESPEGDGVTTFRLYAEGVRSGETGSTTGSPVSANVALEAAAQSRAWAVNSLVSSDPQTAPNAVAVPPLHFARLHAVASAAAGESLAELSAPTEL